MSPIAAPPVGRKLVIVGAGAAGIFTAYRVRQIFGDQYQVQILEASGQLGGNTSSKQVAYGGVNYNIDCGAQFFYKNPQPHYDSLLQLIGLEDPQPQGVVYSAPAGFTIWDRAANARRFWVPSMLSGFGRYDGDDWDRILEFGIFLAYSVFLDSDLGADWSQSVDDWLAGMALVSDHFKQNVIKPFLFQFLSLPLARIGEASARYAVTYLARNLHGLSVPDVSGGDAPVFTTYQSTIGLDGILGRVLQKSQAQLLLNTPVTSVARQGQGLRVTAGGQVIDANDVVLACDPHTSAAVLTAGGTTDPALLDILNALEYGPLQISMQKDGACYMPGDQGYWEPINTIVDGDSVTFSAWFGPLRAPFGGNQQIPVFKSWGAPQVGNCNFEFFSHQHDVVMPTTAFVTTRDQLGAWQGRDGLFFAGGWTDWFDSQEAALDSATAVAQALPGVQAEVAVPRMATVSSDQHHFNLLKWLEMVARAAPASHAAELAGAIEKVAFGG